MHLVFSFILKRLDCNLEVEIKRVYSLIRRETYLLCFRQINKACLAPASLSSRRLDTVRVSRPSAWPLVAI